MWDALRVFKSDDDVSSVSVRLSSNDAPVADQATNATTHSLTAVDPQATCINGDPAWVSVGGSTPAAPGATWVIQLGHAYGGAGAPCLDQLGCQMAAKKPSATPPPFELLAVSGPQSPNCTINPDFCNATQAQVVSCDGAMFLGAKDADLNGTKALFRGAKVLAAAIKQLLTMGLDKASHVLLTGVDHGGTAAVLNADTVAAMLPKTVMIKVLGVDSLHPQFEYMWDIPPQKPTAWKSWCGYTSNSYHGLINHRDISSERLVVCLQTRQRCCTSNRWQGFALTPLTSG